MPKKLKPKVKKQLIKTPVAKTLRKHPGNPANDTTSGQTKQTSAQRLKPRMKALPPDSDGQSSSPPVERLKPRLRKKIGTVSEFPILSSPDLTVEIEEAQGRKIMVDIEIQKNPMQVAAKAKLESYQNTWTVMQWAEFMQKMGNVPFNILDEEKMSQLVYGFYIIEKYKELKAYVLTTNPEAKDEDLVINGDFPEFGIPGQHNQSGPKANPKAGKTWGQEELEQERPKVFADGQVALRVNPLLEASKMSKIARPAPLTEEALAPKAVRQAELHEQNLQADGALPATPQTLETHQAQVVQMKAEVQKTPNEIRWELAKTWAFGKKVEELKAMEASGEIDPEMALIIAYIRSWYKETVQVADMPKGGDLSLVYWPRDMKDGSEEAANRRQAITGRIQDFLSKVNLTFDIEVNRSRVASNSYRITLASMNLEKAIEAYASAFRRNEYQTDQQNVEMQYAAEVKKMALQYVEAHKAVDGQPGPLPTLDPPYAQYMRLLAKYQLPKGTLLHEARL